VSLQHLVEAHFDAFFGGRRDAQVITQPASVTPVPIDIVVYPPHGARAHYTIATLGLSDHEQAGASPERRRQELMMYLPESWSLPNDDTEQNVWRYWAPNLLRTLAEHVIEEGSFYAPGHTVPNESLPPKPYVDGSKLVAALLLPPRAERSGFDPLVAGDIVVSFLVVVPITNAEYELKKAEGSNALLRRMREAALPGHVDLWRESAV